MPRARRPIGVVNEGPLLTRSLMLVYAAGVPLACLWLALPHPGAPPRGALLAIFALAALLGVALLSGRLAGFVAAPLRVTMALTNAMVALGVHLTGVQGSGLELFFLWLTPYAWGFLSIRQAIVQTAIAGAAYALALVSITDAATAGQAIGRWAILVGSIVVLGLLVRRAAASMRDSDARFRLAFESTLVGMALIGTDGRWTDVNAALCEFLGRSREDVLGRGPQELTHPDDWAPARDALTVPNGSALFEKRCIRPDGEVVWAAVTSTAVLNTGGAVRYHVCQVLDVTAQKRALDDRLAQAALQARRVRELELISELSRTALAGAPIDAVLALANEGVGDVLDAEIVGLVTPEPSGAHVRLGPQARLPTGLTTPPSFVVESSLSRHTLRTGEVAVSADLAGDPRFAGAEGVAALGIASALTVPVTSDGRSFGAFGAATLARREFTREDVSFVQGVGNLIGIAMRRVEADTAIAELAAQRRQLVVQALNAADDARRGISELLHERALQDLLAASQDISEAIRHPERGRAALDRAGESLGRGVGELRAAVFELHPLSLSHGGLGSALDALVRRVEQRGGPSCSLHVDPTAEGVQDRLVLSVSRELLANVTKHAGASRVEVRLVRARGRIVLTVRDDGRGMAATRPEQALRDGHIGLASSAERVEAAGGSFAVNSAQDAGTEVAVSLPLSDA